MRIQKNRDELEEVEMQSNVYQHPLQDIDQENLQIMVIIFLDLLFPVFHSLQLDKEPTIN